MGDDLPQDAEVGIDAVELLGAAQGETEAGDHLVENQQGLVPVAELPADSVEVRVEGDRARLATRPLDDQGGNPALRHLPARRPVRARSTSPGPTLMTLLKCCSGIPWVWKVPEYGTCMS